MKALTLAAVWAAPILCAPVHAQWAKYLDGSANPTVTGWGLLGKWNECYLVSSCKGSPTTVRVKLVWNGLTVYDQRPNDLINYSAAEAQFGVNNPYNHAGQLTVTFDWVGTGQGDITPEVSI